MLIAGFDAGQTQTRCRLQRLSPSAPLHHHPPIGEGTGPGVCHLQAVDGEARFKEAIRSSVESALQDARLPWPAAIDAAVIGASGIEEGTAVQDRARQLLCTELQLAADRGRVLGDERTALHGAFPNRAGIVLISGTGMICIGRDRQGREQRTGGWGWRLDGGGSAFDIGHQGLQLTMQMADGRRDTSPLLTTLWAALGCNTPAAVKALVAGPELSVADLAGLAPLVHAAAREGDAQAREVLVRSAASLADAVQAVAQGLALVNPGVSPRGGAITHLELYRDLVTQHLDQCLGDWHWCTDGGDACDGALALAMDCVRPR